MAAPKKSSTQQLKSELANHKADNASLREQLDNAEKRDQQLIQEMQELERKYAASERNNIRYAEYVRSLEEQLDQVHEIFNGFNVPNFNQKHGGENSPMSILQRFSVFLAKR